MRIDARYIDIAIKLSFILDINLHLKKLLQYFVISLSNETCSLFIKVVLCNCLQIQTILCVGIQDRIQSVLKVIKLLCEDVILIEANISLRWHRSGIQSRHLKHFSKFKLTIFIIKVQLKIISS